MVTLYTVYQLMCSDITIHKGYIRPYTMSEKEFYSRVFSADLKEAFASLLNPEHHSFQADAFAELSRKKNHSKKHLKSIIAYFMEKPSAIEILLQTSQVYLAKETSTIRWDYYVNHMKKWIRLLPMGNNTPLKKYLLNACNDISQYPVPMTWMLLDAFSTSPKDLSSLYQKYSSWSSACTSASYLPLLKMANGLRQLYTHARNSMNNKWENRDKQHASLCREFNNLEALYEENTLLFPEKNFQPLLKESFDNFRHFLIDFQRKSMFSDRYLELMRKNIESLEELLSKYP